MTIDLLLSGLLQGTILALLATALMIPFRLLHLPDLTAEGAYPFGGALYAGMLLLGLPPLWALLAGLIGGSLLGLATSWLHGRWQMNSLLAGILLSTMIYSVNLRLMGRPNLALFDHPSLLSGSTLYHCGWLLLIVVGSTLPLLLFLQTEWGLRLRAVGLNADFAQRQAISVAGYRRFGLMLAGSLSALAGAVTVDYQRYMDIGMGVGIVIHALAALMIGEAVMGDQTLRRRLSAPLVGALIYQQIQGLVLSLGLPPSDLKLLTGSLVLVVLALRRNPRNSPLL
jgi:putative ABC transport system permease protein